MKQIEVVLHGYGFEDSDMEWERARGASLSDLLGIRRGRVDPRWERDDEEDWNGFITVANRRGDP